MPAAALLLAALLQSPLEPCATALREAKPSAVALCKSAVGADPTNAQAHLLLAQAYLATRNISMVAEAKAELQQALDLDDSLLWARFYLARVYLDQGFPAKARKELLAALAVQPNTPHFLALLGETERKLDHSDLALQLLKRALELDPALNTARYYLALVYIDLHQDDPAIAELEASLKSPYLTPELYLTLGSLYAQRHRFSEAEALCHKAIALDPSRSEGYLNLAQLHNAQHHSTQALAALRQALPEGKNFTSSPYYQKLLADIHFEFGRAYAFQNDRPNAIRAFLACLELDARPAAHRRLAELYEAQGDPARARQHLAAATK